MSSVLERLNLGVSNRLPVILQTEASECGLACLAMIACHFGFASDFSQLRARFGISLKGATMREIVRIGDAMGFVTRPLRLELDELKHLRLPCILHWDLNHFVVLARVTSRGVVIHDPLGGQREMNFADVSRHFTGVALECSPTALLSEAKPAPRIKAAQLLGKINGLKRSLSTLLSLALAIELMAMIGPFFMAWVVDQALVSADRDLLTTLAVGFLLLLLLQTGTSAIRGWMLLGLNVSLKAQSRANLFSHLVHLPTTFFEARHLGDIMSRFGSQETILQAITSELVEAILDGFLAAITIVIMAFFAPDLAAIVLVGAALYGGLRWISYAPLRLASLESIVWSARRDSHFLETLRGIRTVKLFNAQEERRTRWLNLLIETINRQLTTEKLGLSFRTANKLLLGILNIVIVYLGARKVLDGNFSVGLLLAFVAYKDQFLGRVSELINKGVDLTMLRVHAERVADIALTPPEPHRPQALSETEYLPATIELRNIRFRYADSEPWVLDGVNCTFRRGESVAIVGPSGGGKTTLLKILSGLVQPTEGTVLVNGEPITKVGINKYRAMLGVVMQDDQLFSGSIVDNICFFDDRPDLERIESVARAAAVHDDIAAMPMGYDTLIGDMGTVLSGGQKQRVLIARALYRRPAVLLLDEATSHLDVEREGAVNSSLRSMHVTRVVIAHRPETIRAADRIVTLEDGKLDREQANRHHTAY